MRAGSLVLVTISATSSSDARERLLTAWRGEILAGAVYELIAQRMPPREADILRRMAEAESGHRNRLEARMQELGIEIPDPASVRVPLWLRLQARIAPVDRLLAAREAAEDEEVDDLYKRSTGDEVTDRLLRSIRKEERSHSMAVQDIRSGSARDDPLGAGGSGAPPSSAAPLAVPGAQARLDRILGRERWHPDRRRLDLRRDLRRQRWACRRVRDRRRCVGRD